MRERERERQNENRRESGDASELYVGNYSKIVRKPPEWAQVGRIPLGHLLIRSLCRGRWGHAGPAPRVQNFPQTPNGMIDRSCTESDGRLHGPRAPA